MKSSESPSKPRFVRLFLTGFGMGTADLIPGVSGGTIAFISGIYEELLRSIKTITGKTLSLILRGNIRGAWESVPVGFLFPLAAGLFSAIFSLANLLGYLLEAYPAFVYAFFFGLVIASAFAVARKIPAWNVTYGIVAVVCFVGAYYLVGAIPVETPNTLPMFFLAGMIAICAMILPGISGSFILLILGKYAQVLGAVRELNLIVLAVFAAGCAVGISFFSRILSWLFAKHHDLAVAGLSGVMIGSARKLWPWQEVVSTRINSHGEVVPLLTRNIVPEIGNIATWGALGLMIAGVVIILAMLRFDREKA